MQKGILLNYAGFLPEFIATIIEHWTKNCRLVIANSRKAAYKYSHQNFKGDFNFRNISPRNCFHLHLSKQFKVNFALKTDKLHGYTDLLTGLLYILGNTSEKRVVKNRENVMLAKQRQSTGCTNYLL